jgi:hypothetical protein
VHPVRRPDVTARCRRTEGHTRVGSQMEQTKLVAEAESEKEELNVVKVM